MDSAPTLEFDIVGDLDDRAIEVLAELLVDLAEAEQEQEAIA